MKKILFSLLLALCAPFAFAADSDNTLEKAKAGDAKAQYHLYSAYTMGNRYNLSAPEAIKWLTEAAESGLPAAQSSLADVYKKGLHGVAQNDAQYVYWLTAAANHDTFKNIQHDSGLVIPDYPVSAQYDLACVYGWGEYGVKKNMDEYLKWATISANNGYPKACLSLGRYYKKKHKKQEAIYWLKKAIELQGGNMYSFENLEAAKELRKLGVKEY